MTRDGLERIVREWQRRLNIPHWRVKIDWDTPADEENAAQIERHGDQYEGATIRFTDGWTRWSEQEANETIAHELMHILAFDLQTAAESAEEVMTSPAFKLFNRRFHHELEGVVDRVALLLVQFAGIVPAKEETHVHN